MTEADIQLYFAYAGGLGLLLGLINLALGRQKPCRVQLAGACFSLSGAALSYRFALPIWVTGVMGVATVALLVMHARCSAATRPS